MKIDFIANKDTNYVFHMLSVADCGYDNDYGKRYKHRYPEADLSILKEYENELTVCGGEHCGALYYLLVCRPACAEVSAKDYYNDLIGSVKIRELAERYQTYADGICKIAAVMVKHYDDFVNNIWHHEAEQIRAYIPAVSKLFEETRFAERAVEVVGHKPPQGTFSASFVTSIENGAEGIDISDAQDVFGIEREPLDALYFIGHEYIIYLLFSALKEEPAFRSFETWGITEGLAEFYLKKLLGDTRFFVRQQRYVAFYESCNHNLSAAELYRAALQEHVGE